MHQWAYVFRHRRLEALGRLLLQNLPNDWSQARYEVAGRPADPIIDHSQACGTDVRCQAGPKACDMTRQ